MLSPNPSHGEGRLKNRETIRNVPMAINIRDAIIHPIGSMSDSLGMLHPYRLFPNDASTMFDVAPRIDVDKV